MKNIIRQFVCANILGFMASAAQGTPIVTETFSYTNGVLAGNNGGTGWEIPWSVYQGGAAVTNGFAIIDAAAGQQVYRRLPAQNKTRGGSIWLRFSARQFTTGSGSTLTYGGLDLYHGGAEKMLAGKFWQGNYVWAFGTSGGGQVSASSTLVPTVIYENIVFNPAGNDVCNVWINPKNPAWLQASNVAPNITYSSPDLSFDTIALRGGIDSGIAESWKFGALAMGTTLADGQTPSAPVSASRLKPEGAGDSAALPSKRESDR